MVDEEIVRTQRLTRLIGIPLRPDDTGDEHLRCEAAALMSKTGMETVALDIDAAKVAGVGQSGPSQSLGARPERRRADLHRDIVATADIEVLAVDALQGRATAPVLDQPGDPHVGVDGDVSLVGDAGLDAAVG